MSPLFSGLFNNGSERWAATYTAVSGRVYVIVCRSAWGHGGQTSFSLSCSSGSHPQASAGQQTGKLSSVDFHLALMLWAQDMGDC